MFPSLFRNDRGNYYSGQACTADRIQIHLHNQIAGRYGVAGFHKHSESFSLQFDSIQTCVDQDVPAVRGCRSFHQGRS